MKSHAKLIIVTALALLTLGLMQLDRTHLTADDTPDVAEKHLARQPVPDTVFTLLDGGTVSLHSLSGHTVLLHFWASWCAPCRAEFPALLERVRNDGGNTILLAVSGDKNAQDIRNFLAPLMHDFKPLFDAKQVIIAQDADRALIEDTFQTFQYPETIVIGPDLAMQRKIAGPWED